LSALDAGDLEMADIYAWEASAMYIAALEAQVRRVRKSDRGALEKPAKRRGRLPGSRNVKGR
jgi:hypothetical protein